jgi:uroporphyrin-3 C-methyltransferase
MTDSATPPTVHAAAPPIAAPPTAARAQRRSGWMWPLVLLALAGGGGWLWYGDHQRAERERVANIEATQRLEALEARLDRLRGDVRGHSQRLQQADATNRVLRDELLGMNQRAALIEDNLAKLVDANRQGAQALRLDEAELLLTLGQQRLQLAADLDGARRAYALAAGVLDGVDGPGFLNLRQTLAQERAALDALDADPRHTALLRLDALAAKLPDPATLPRAPAPSANAPWWDRVLARLVSVRRTDAPTALASEDRSAGDVALQLELTLARTAIERRDALALRAALDRADAWLLRLWPASPQRRALRDALRALRDAPLTLDMPLLGSTLEQMRAQRGP